MEIKKALLKQDLSEISLKDLIYMINVLSELGRTAWNNDNRRTATTLFELANVMTDFVLDKYVMKFEDYENSTAEAQ